MAKKSEGRKRREDKWVIMKLGGEKAECEQVVVDAETQAKLTDAKAVKRYIKEKLIGYFMFFKNPSYSWSGPRQINAFVEFANADEIPWDDIKKEDNGDQQA